MNLKEALFLLSKGKKISIVGKDYYFYYGKSKNDKKFVIFKEKEDTKFKYAKIYVWDVKFPNEGYYEYV